MYKSANVSTRTADSQLSGRIFLRYAISVSLSVKVVTLQTDIALADAAWFTLWTEYIETLGTRWNISHLRRLNYEFMK